MIYVSTEGRARPVPLEDALFSGTAEDGGLYVPESLPELALDGLGGDLAERASSVARALFSGDVPTASLEEIVRESLTFDIPLVRVEEGVFCLELFHGPTLAFKDVGARFMARLVRHFLAGRGREATVLVATSGDTGSAVAHAFHGLAGVRVVVLFPHGRVSRLQRKLFTTLGENVSALAIEGSFDDCQRMVKRAFADRTLSRERSLVSANSINVGRLLPQTFYYVHGWAELGPRSAAPVFSTPSGNFGNLTAGLIAARMGLPVRRFVAATNANDVVPEYLRTGVFRPRPSVSTLSNAMDVGDPSNFARIRWLYGDSLERIRADVAGAMYTDEDTRRTIAELYQRTGYLVDPHSAIGYRGGLTVAKSLQAPLVFLATAHPAKFAETVEDVTGTRVPLPGPLAEVEERAERSVRLKADYGELVEYLGS